MAKSYPHRQTVVIAIACAVAVAGTVAYVHWQTPPTQTVQPDIAAGEAGSGTSTNATIGGFERLEETILRYDYRSSVDRRQESRQSRR